MTSSSSTPILCSILRQNYLCLSTVDDEGQPWSSPLFFGVTSNLEFIFISGAESRHARNIRSNGRAAWSIYLGDAQPEETDGLTFKGEARELDNFNKDNQIAADVLYDQRFPDAAIRAEHPANLARFEESGRRLYVLAPTEAFKVDRNDPLGVSRVSVELDTLRSLDPPHLRR